MFDDHAITRGEIEGLAKAKPETVVVGTGTSGKATISDRLMPERQS
jgi:hypothetical protein